MHEKGVGRGERRSSFEVGWVLGRSLGCPGQEGKGGKKEERDAFSCLQLCRVSEEEEEHFSQPHAAAIVEPEYRFVLLPAGAFTFPLSLPPFTACLLQQCLFFSLHGGDVTGDAGSVPTRKGIAVSYGFFIFWVLEFFFISSTHLSVRDISTHS